MRAIQALKNFLMPGLISAGILLSCTGKTSTSPDEGIGAGYLTALPLEEKDITLFVNLGHLNPPGHVFPSDHGGFYLTNSMAKVPVYAPAAMRIIEISAVKHLTDGITDYVLAFSSKLGSFKVVLGHLSGIEAGILAQAPALEGGNCETYMAGGKQYQKCAVRVNISVQAGQVIGAAGGNPGQYGVDFGVFDRNRKNKFATDRLKEYDYSYAVSPLDYYSTEIAEALKPICGDYICDARLIRTIPPIGGTIAFDVAGTAQGIWFKKGAPTFPEDAQIALIYDNVEPGLPVFSNGTSIDGLNAGVYTFVTKSSGLVNRPFKEVSADGKIYRYEITHQCSGVSIGDKVILLKMNSKTELLIECQNASAGPDWKFTAKAVTYTR